MKVQRNGPHSVSMVCCCSGCYASEILIASVKREATEQNNGWQLAQAAAADISCFKTTEILKNPLSLCMTVVLSFETSGL